MLVDHLLLAIADQYHHKVIVTCDDTPELKAVHQEQRDRHPVPPYLLSNRFLEIIGFCHICIPSFFGMHIW